MDIVLIAILCGFAAVMYGIVTSRAVLAAPAGNERMQTIAAAIQEGAKAYLAKQYTTIAVVGVIVAIVMFFALGEIYPTIAFVLGAVLSGVTGFIGMNISVRANVRTAEAARGSLQGGLSMAFRAGAVTGMLVAGLALLAIAGYFYYLTSLGYEATSRTVIDSLVALSFGASLISIFARLGGGIFTKAADVGADMVGKNELGFDEDDERNPGVIADNVGDNVGDCAGMAADLFETYVVTIGATMVLCALLVAGNDAARLMALPLLAGGVCIITSIVGTFFVRLGRNNSIMGALYKGFIVAALLSIPALYFATNAIFPDMNATIGAATMKPL
jgi:K(+)-stimulated pyrophosphate-energized sodium pump